MSLAVSSHVPAAHQTLAVLRYLARQPGPVPAATIARDLELPRSTTYHLLAVMARDAFVVHLPEEQRWGLGAGAFEIGSAYTHQAPLARLARPLVAHLVDTSGWAAHVAVLHGRDVLYVVEERAPGRPPLVSDVGVRLPSHLTASGRSMLAALPAAQVRALFPDAAAFTLRTGAGPTTPSALRQVLVATRRRGFAVEDGEVSPGLASVGVVVPDHTGHPAAAVACTFPAEALDDDARRRLAALVAGTARDLTRRTGGRPPPR